MKPTFLRFAFLLLSCLVMRAGEPAAAAGKSHPLVWDATEKAVDAKAGESAAEFEFRVTNRSEKPVEIVQLRPSCGCTVAEMPANPWILAPGASGSFRATVDFTGKHGKLVKTNFVNSNAGTQMLSMVINIADTDVEARQRNQQLALADRQAVFRGDCASCHAAPARDKRGAELFAAACAVCHLAANRASMVPDLVVAREPRDAAFWRKWISEGKARTLMPAFAQEHGGPLTPEQIESLVEFALATFPRQPAAQ